MEYDNFENALNKLKQIIKEFEEEDNISIESLLENYEEGMKAYSFCAKKLDETQRKIKVIDDTFGQSPDFIWINKIFIHYIYDFSNYIKINNWYL